jgi:cytochrome P450
VSALRERVRALTGATFQRDPLTYLRSIDDGSPVLRFRAGLSTFFVVCDPEAIHRVLVADAERYGEGKWTLRGKRVMGDCLITREGEAHRRRRQLVQPAFERLRLEPKAAAVTDRAARLADRWREGEEVEMRAAMAELALAAASDLLFSVELDQASGELVPALMAMLAEIPRPGPPLRSSRPLTRARRVFDGSVPDAIAAADGPVGDAHGDVLSRLRAGNDREPGLDDHALADELISLLIASIDTAPAPSHGAGTCWRRTVITSGGCPRSSPTCSADGSRRPPTSSGCRPWTGSSARSRDCTRPSTSSTADR